MKYLILILLLGMSCAQSEPKSMCPTCTADTCRRSGEFEDEIRKILNDNTIIATVCKTMGADCQCVNCQFCECK